MIGDRTVVEAVQACCCGPAGGHQSLIAYSGDQLPEASSSAIWREGECMHGRAMPEQCIN